ncbi:ATP-binding protein [Aurantiacibacter gangjinensis]|uniref:histidine kinase n=1 Tax=Aurantiacibacter gangjinensis TaxID=502682 RepID=A0A0G9MQL5_9SPHN|nr:ATP-binding protein [Aurantiacibacter gangjinensis]APE28700.1 Nitrogen regulation protein NtrY [Aurantiacibacter gangjinensis]KLE32864.1 ATPase [Aurantiacibacter gangjinensis]
MADEPISQTAPPVGGRSRLRRRAAVTARKVNLFFWLEVACIIALVGMLGTLWLTLANLPSDGEPLPSAQAAYLLLGTLLPALGLIVLWGRRIAIRRAGGTTARLHVNLVFFFSLLAAVPTLIVAVFASILFQSGVEFWFSRDSRGILQDASQLAQDFYDENQRAIGGEALTMAMDLRFFSTQLELEGAEFWDQYSQQTLNRNLSESAILAPASDGNFRVLAIVDPDDDYDRVRLTNEDAEYLQSGQPVVMRATPERTEAITALFPAREIYLYVSRDSDAEAVAQYERAQNVIGSYDNLTDEARVLQLQFNFALFGVSLALVALAVWAALRFADRQVKPLTELADAAGEIGAGNYAMRVSGRTGPDEIGTLNRAFNRMSAQIETQTDALLGANRQLAERRAFIEAVLQSITAGIVSVDADGRILLMNSSAQRLLLDSEGPVPVETPLEDVAPQLHALVAEGAKSEIIQISQGAELLTLAVQVAPATGGHVITFEDITRQLLDQRQAAWSDVARRIAHEIKNPLTPIQLATERLKRRYARQIEQDAELFDELTGTIIRQVGDLRKMVDEFSSFARLPKPVFRSEDAVDLVRQALFLQEVAHPEIAYSFEADSDIPAIECDRHQLGQAMTNVLKNAAEAVEARIADAPADWRGRIGVTMQLSGDHVEIAVNDNGTGLPQGSVNVMEPYVTTREKGTGLGLAIVKKIVEEHAGDLEFAARPEGGTRAVLRFAVRPADLDEHTEAAE